MSRIRGRTGPRGTHRTLVGSVGQDGFSANGVEVRPRGRAAFVHIRWSGNSRRRRVVGSVGDAQPAADQPGEAHPDDLAEVIDGLNADPEIHGILLQLPLPSHLDPDAFVDRISPYKDVDGLTATSVGMLAQNRPRYVPCTPAGVQQILLRSGVET